MIKLVKIENWRSYDDLVVDLNSKVVFFVAPNGVGKTSFIEAVRWCIIGEPELKIVKSAIRHDNRPVSVKVVLALNEGESELEICRSLPVGAETEEVRFEALKRKDGISTKIPSEEAYKEILSEECSAPLTLIDKLMFPPPRSQSLKPFSSRGPAREDLASILGITQINQVLGHLSNVKKECKDRVTELREMIEELKTDDPMLDISETSMSDSEPGIEILEDGLQQLSATIHAAESWAIFRKTYATYKAVLEDISVKLGPGPTINVSSALDILSKEQSKANEVLAEARKVKAEYDFAKIKTATASELLVNPIEKCPTCLRALSEQERQEALRLHNVAVSEADIVAEANIIDAAEADQRVALISDSITRLARLQLPLQPSEQDPSIDSEEHLESLRLESADLKVKIERRRNDEAKKIVLKPLRDALTRRERELKSAVRKDLLLATLIGALKDLTKRATKDRFTPLSEELSKLWESFFDSHNLTLEPSLGVKIESPFGKKLRPDDLSAGESSTLDLFTRLIVADRATTIPTVWLDEPLESIDPRRREELASIIASTGQVETAAQVIVTTYEERIANELAGTFSDTVRVVYADPS